MTLKPIDVACAHQNKDKTNCGAAAGQSCVFWGQEIGGMFHPERTRDAAAATTGPAAPEPSKQEFEQAVEAAELF